MTLNPDQMASIVTTAGGHEFCRARERVSRKVAVKTCIAKRKNPGTVRVSRPALFRPRRTQRLVPSQITDHKASVAVAAAVAVVAAASPTRVPGVVQQSEVCEDLTAAGRANAMATKWFTGAPFGVQSRRCVWWGGPSDGGLEPGGGGAIEGGGLAGRRGGRIFSPPSAGCTSLLPAILFKVLSGALTMCCSERSGGLAHSRSLSPKVVGRISAQVSYIHMI